MKGRTIHVIFGSTSDFTEEIADAISKFEDNTGQRVVINVLSCHRHPLQLMVYLQSIPKDEFHHRIVAAGSMAFALPGIIRAFLNIFHNPVQVIGVALNGKESIDLEAAKLSISRLPGTPVIMATKIADIPYIGVKGFEEALYRAFDDDELGQYEIKNPPPCHTGLDLVEAIKLFCKK